jgi:acetolactate synthase-1/2/3 large subunit
MQPAGRSNERREEPSMLVMNVIAEILKKEGVSTLFCFPTTPIIEAAAAVGIKPVICRQERVGVHMADGFSRVSNGRPPGVFAMQYGPGAENAFAGVATAFSDSSPVVFLPLGHPRETAQLFPMFKSSRTYASITKSVEEVILPEEVGNVMRRAFAQAKNGRSGPVMVEVPADVHSAEVNVDPGKYQPVRATRSAGDTRDIDEAAGMLLATSCPMILAGQGVFYALASAGDDHLRRQERLPGGSRAGARTRRGHLYRARPAHPA